MLKDFIELQVHIYHSLPHFERLKSNLEIERACSICFVYFFASFGTIFIHAYLKRKILSSAMRKKHNQQKSRIKWKQCRCIICESLTHFVYSMSIFINLIEFWPKTVQKLFICKWKSSDDIDKKREELLTAKSHISPSNNTCVSVSTSVDWIRLGALYFTKSFLYSSIFLFAKALKNVIDWCHRTLMLHLICYAR